MRHRRLPQQPRPQPRQLVRQVAVAVGGGGEDAIRGKLGFVAWDLVGFEEARRVSGDGGEGVD